MPITPPERGGFRPAGEVPFSSHPKKHRLDQSPESRAREAEKDAMIRVRNAQNTIEEANHQAEEQLSQLKDEYVRQSLAETNRQEAAYESQRNDGYEQLRELKRNQQSELSRVRREGERDLAILKNYYRDMLYSTERGGEQDFEELRSQFARSNDYERRMANDELEILQKDNTRRVEELIAQQDETFAGMTEAARQEYERIKENSVRTQEQAEKHFLSAADESHRRQNETLSHLYGRANEKIRAIRQESAQKLDAYSRRQKDPFYKLMDTDAKLTETEDAFILRATIPTHEQKHVSVSIRGDQIVLSGKRRNEEKLDLGDGRVKTTATFQSFSESFPLGWPVEAKLLSRQFEGEELVVEVPKKSLGKDAPLYQAKRPDKARVERPKFPENLPHTEAAETPEEDPELKPSPKTIGSRTLA